MCDKLNFPFGGDEIKKKYLERSEGGNWIKKWIIRNVDENNIFAIIESMLSQIKADKKNEANWRIVKLRKSAMRKMWKINQKLSTKVKKN